MWAKNNLKETTILFSSKSNHEKLSKFLEPRFALAKTISGTLKYHAVIPASEDKLILKEFSFDKKQNFFSRRKEKGKKKKWKRIKKNKKRRKKEK